MADNVKPTFSKASVKSGLDIETYAEKILDGIPAKKDVEQIEEENRVKKAPGSVMKS